MQESDAVTFDNVELPGMVDVAWKAAMEYARNRLHKNATAEDIETAATLCCLSDVVATKRGVYHHPAFFGIDYHGLGFTDSDPIWNRYIRQALEENGTRITLTPSEIRAWRFIVEKQWCYTRLEVLRFHMEEDTGDPCLDGQFELPRQHAYALVCAVVSHLESDVYNPLPGNPHINGTLSDWQELASR